MEWCHGVRHRQVIQGSERQEATVDDDGHGKPKADESNCDEPAGSWDRVGRRLRLIGACLASPSRTNLAEVDGWRGWNSALVGTTAPCPRSEAIWQACPSSTGCPCNANLGP